MDESSSPHFFVAPLIVGLDSFVTFSKPRVCFERHQVLTNMHLFVQVCVQNLLSALTQLSSVNLNHKLDLKVTAILSNAKHVA